MGRDNEEVWQRFLAKERLGEAAPELLAFAEMYLRRHENPVESMTSPSLVAAGKAAYRSATGKEWGEEPPKKTLSETLASLQERGLIRQDEEGRWFATEAGLAYEVEISLDSVPAVE